MPLDDELVYNELIKITRLQGQLTERTACLPDLHSSVIDLKQQFQDHMRHDHGCKPLSRGKQKGLVALLLVGLTTAAATMGTFIDYLVSRA